MSDEVKTGRDAELEAQADAVLKPDVASLVGLPERLAEQQAQLDAQRGSAILPGGEGVVTLRIPVSDALTPTRAVERAQEAILHAGLRDWIYIVENVVGDRFLVRGTGEEVSLEELGIEDGEG